MANFVYGITDEMKQKRREQLLDVTKDQIREVAQKYIVGALSQNTERIVFLGEKRDFVDKSWAINEMDINGSA